jgi:hypothetical protein
MKPQPAKVCLLILVCLLCLTACSSGASTSKNDIPLTTTAISTTELPAPTFQPSLTESPLPSPESTSTAEPTATSIVEANLITTYTLNAILDVEEKTLSVNEQISYLNTSGKNLTELPLVIPVNRTEDQFILKAIQLPADTETTPIYTLDGETLTLSLAKDLQPNENYTVLLAYEIILPDNNGPFGYTGRQFNLADWYAFVPPYQLDNGWMINPYHPIGEYLVYDAADFDVTLSLAVPDPAMVIAAGAPATREGDSWYFSLRHARTFVWSASTEFLILQQADTPSVTAYILPEHEEQGWSALSTTISALNLYSYLYGTYPHETLTLVEGDFNDGMEYDGLYYLGIDYFQDYEGGEKNYLTAIAAHETAHQWWFSAVGNNAAREPWLDESLAIYSEFFFYQTYYPGDEDWWWNFRVDSFNPQGWVNSEVYEYSQFRPYINAVYLRGARFLHELRQTMGDEAFLAFLKAYYQEGDKKLITREDFFRILGQYTSADLSSLLKQYFR